MTALLAPTHPLHRPTDFARNAWGLANLAPEWKEYGNSLPTPKDVTVARYLGLHGAEFVTVVGRMSGGLLPIAVVLRKEGDVYRLEYDLIRDHYVNVYPEEFLCGPNFSPPMALATLSGHVKRLLDKEVRALPTTPDGIPVLPSPFVNEFVIDSVELVDGRIIARGRMKPDDKPIAFALGGKS